MAVLTIPTSSGEKAMLAAATIAANVSPTLSFVGTGIFEGGMPVSHSPTLKAILIASVLALGSNNYARAEDDSYAALKSFSELTSDKTDNDGCWVIATADFEQFGPHLSLIREAWLDRDYSLDFYTQRRKQVFLFIILNRLGDVITETLYTDDKRDRCAFTIAIKYFDKIGQQKISSAVSWEFTREKFVKVNWNNFDPRNFTDVAIDYKISPEIPDWYSDEPKMANISSPAPSASCDQPFLRANAIFIRATTYCPKDYMDSRAGYYALAMSRHCAAGINEDRLKSVGRSAMQELDAVVRQRGKRAACRWVDDVERDIERAVVN